MGASYILYCTPRFIFSVYISPLDKVRIEICLRFLDSFGCLKNVLGLSFRHQCHCLLPLTSLLSFCPFFQSIQSIQMMSPKMTVKNTNHSLGYPCMALATSKGMKSHQDQISHSHYKIREFSGAGSSYNLSSKPNIFFLSKRVFY